MFVGAVAGQTFVPGRKLQGGRGGRAIKPPTEICSPGDNKKTFCNGLDNPICDATGIVVSDN